MPARILTLAFAALAGLALGAPDLDAQDAKKSEIRGTVVTAADRKPIKGAKVSLEGQNLALNTDEKGRFKFPKVAAGTYVIRAEVDGYPPATSTLLLSRDDRVEVEFQVGTNDAVDAPRPTVTGEDTRISPVAEFNRRATGGSGTLPDARVHREAGGGQHDGPAPDRARGPDQVREERAALLAQFRPAQ